MSDQDPIDFEQLSMMESDPETRRILKKMEEERREPLDTRSMLEQGFFKALGNPDIQDMADNMRSGGVVKITKDSVSGLTKFASSDNDNVSEEGGPASPKPTSFYEKACLKIIELKDELVRAFPDVSSNERVAFVFTQCIRKAESILDELGFSLDESEKFNPILHASGLKGDDPMKNAKQVVANTVAMYQTFKIAATDIADYKGHPCVSVRIDGNDERGPFVALGTVVAKTDFTGSEAIDYVRKSGQGLFSVKCSKLGRWVNVSNDFHVVTKHQVPEATEPTVESSQSQIPQPQ